jgi:hypothetical protein
LFGSLISDTTQLFCADAALELAVLAPAPITHSLTLFFHTH